MQAVENSAGGVTSEEPVPVRSAPGKRDTPRIAWVLQWHLVVAWLYRSLTEVVLAARAVSSQPLPAPRAEGAGAPAETACVGPAADVGVSRRPSAPGGTPAANGGEQAQASPGQASPGGQASPELAVTTGVSSVIGKKSEQQDAHDSRECTAGPHYVCHGVYDGHSGTAASRFCAEHLLAYLLGHKGLSLDGEGEPEAPACKWVERPRGLETAFEHLDRAFFHSDPEEAQWAGTTALVSVLNVTDRTLQVANCGDSVAILCRGGAAHVLTTPHRASVPSEQARIASLRAAGVSEVTTELDYEARWRCARDLEVTRAIGDFFEHPRTKDVGTAPATWGVSATPEVTRCALRADDAFLIMATDGLDALKAPPDCAACGASGPRDESALTCLECEATSWGRVVDAAAAGLAAGDSPEAVARRLADDAVIAGGGCADNCTVIITRFDHGGGA